MTVLHLQIMSEERRQHPRASASIPVELRAPSFGDLAKDATSDLSAGGMFIRTERALEEGDVIDFRILTEREGGVIEGKARVARVTADGVGVEFLELVEPNRSMLNTLVALQARSKEPA